jgi:hypothetical protein
LDNATAEMQQGLWLGFASQGSFFCRDLMVDIQYIKWQGKWFVPHHSLLTDIMHTYTSRALHVLSVSSVESPLSSKLFIWLAAVNIAVASIKTWGWSLPVNRRKPYLGICVATLGTSIPTLYLVSSKRVDGMHQLYISITRTNQLDNGWWQRSWFSLVLLLHRSLVIYEVLLAESIQNVC